MSSLKLAISRQLEERQLSFQKSEKWSSRAYQGNSSLLSWATPGGRKFPVQDSDDLTYENLICHKIVIGPCPEGNSEIERKKYLLSRSEESDSELAAQFHIVRKKPA